MSRFNRSNFYKTESVNGIAERDFLSSHLNELTLNRDATFYTIKFEDIGRPDLISIKVYGQQDYWWIIGYINNIADWWNDIEEMDVIKIPNMVDIQDWILKVKK